MGTDYYGVLGVARGLEWPVEAMRDRYDQLCREVHPDRGGDGADFEQVRRAYAELGSPGRRLRHWLETGGVEFDAGGALPAVVMDHFADLGPLLQKASEVGQRHASAQSALVRSLAEREGMSLLPRLEQAMARTREQIAGLEARFPAIESGDADAKGGEAVEVARCLLFLEKWERELREAWGRMGCW